MARSTVGIIAIIYDKLSVYPKVLSCCCMTPSMTSAVNNVIGINESHLTTISGKLTLDIIIKGIIRMSNVTIPHKIISISVCKSVVIYPLPPLRLQRMLRLLILLHMKASLNLKEASL